MDTSVVVPPIGGEECENSPSRPCKKQRFNVPRAIDDVQFRL